MSTVSSFLLSAGCLVGAIWELARHALRFAWVMLLPKAVLDDDKRLDENAVSAFDKQRLVP
jgi:hypothetical protein